ncbi:MAG: GGDEF domain-containing protein [Pseudomonadota bacterium]|nr:GGDEF domain-containing protein [Pseudomonadota bacterium]
MQISEFEIKSRMKLLSLEPDALELLASHRPIIERHLEEIVDLFYEKQTAVEEIALLIGDADTLKRLRAAQNIYVMDLFGGFYDIEYVNNRLRIGMVHKRIGVEPKLYLSAVSTLKQIIIKTLSTHIENKDVLPETLIALDKLFYFDSTLVFDTYIDSLLSEIQSAKNRIEIYAKSLEETVAERTRKLEQQARIDPLTNIYNQRAMQEMTRTAMMLGQRRQTPISVLYLDVDNFKNINDSKGHQEGDDVLKSLATILSNRSRETDVASRYGGDEFCIILPDCDIENAKLIAQNIIDDLTVEYHGEVQLSIGIAQTGPKEFMTSDDLINLADKKMYEAKKEPGFQIRF